MDTSPKALALLAVDSTLDNAVEHWKALDRDSLLDVGDALISINTLSQLAIGLWLVVFEDELGYGGIKELASRWGKSDATLYDWKYTATALQSSTRVELLPNYTSAKLIARQPQGQHKELISLVIEEKPTTRQLKEEIKRRKALSENIIEVSPLLEDKSDETIVLEPEPESSEPSSAPKQSESEVETPEMFSFRIGRLAISVRWERAARD